MDKIIDTVLFKMIGYFGRDVRRVSHALKVYGYAKAISCCEEVSGEDRFVVGLAAILHDIGIKEAERKYNSSAGKYQELEGPPVTEGLLSQMDIEKSVVERVCFLVGNHHSYGKIDGVDFQVLVEADFLVNIAEEALDLESINSIKQKYFKTKTGLDILLSLYGV